MKLSDFEPMPKAWRGEGLLGTKGNPIEESVAARPAFSYVYSARPEDHHGIAENQPRPAPPPAPPTPPLVPPMTDVEAELDALAAESGLPRSFLREMLDVLDSDMPHLVLAGPPGTGKTWLGKKLSDIGHPGPGPSYSLVQFHPSYSYEDFIEGLRPSMRDKQIVFENEDGHLLRLVNKLPDGGPTTLIIDELNRANIPSVFGELLYLLEYRNESASLRLSGEFRLPPEVRFIATMNTADRSIRSMDSALRRRFEVFELGPNPDVLRNYYKVHGANEVGDLVDGFERLNQRLGQAIDRHHGIGHSFFMRKAMTPSALRATWLRKVLPLIEEYFFDEPHRVEAEFSFDELWPSLSS
jgi:hypothetical protein